MALLNQFYQVETNSSQDEAPQQHRRTQRQLAYTEEKKLCEKVEYTHQQKDEISQEQREEVVTQLKVKLSKTNWYTFNWK